MESKEKAKLIYDTLDNKLAVDVSIIDISNISILADYFIIAGGKNKSHIQTLADSINDDLAKVGEHPKQIEGYNTASWILMDYSDVIVHIFSEEDRLFYDLEKIWSDGKSIAPENLEN